ncbi:YibE/F family protein [Candidatus Poribacteria bacterium]
MKEWKIKLLALAAIILICLLVDMRFFRGFSRETKEGQTGITEVLCIGRVIALDAGRATGEPPYKWTWSPDGQIVTLQVLSGRFKGQEVYTSNIFIGEYSDRVFRVGDRLYLTIPSRDGRIVGTRAIGLGEYVRTSFLLYLATSFFALMVIIGGGKGVRASLSLVVSGLFIGWLLIPMFLAGYNPVWSAILIATVNTALTFMLVGGMTKKSLAGVLGTVGGLITAAILASFSCYILRFTGLDIYFGFLSLGKRLWMSVGDTWNFRDLMTAGMILGASGAIMDASMAVASAIDEVKRANPQIGIRGCIRAGMNVGKDEMGTMANTLIFAYIGADITLALLPMVRFEGVGQAYPFTRVINGEAGAAEIVQALTGTIGLIMAIPITAVIAGFLIGRTHGADTADKATGGSLKWRWAVSVVMLIVALGTHFVYSATRHASAVQMEDTEKFAVSEYVRAKVLEGSESIDIPSVTGYARDSAKSKTLRVKLLGGSHGDEQVLVRNVRDPSQIPLYANTEFNSGDEVLLKVNGTREGIHEVLLNNLSRDGYLVYLTGFFVLLMVIVGRFQGLRTVLALGISITVIFKVMLPLIMAGYNPVMVVIIVSGFIALSSLVIITGFNRKTGAATIGILGGVVVASILVIYADQNLHFTGIASSRNAVVRMFTPQGLDFRKILMAGIIMGLLGTAMDAAIVVASAVREVRRVNPKMTVAQLISAGMNVGTDVLGTMANTLVFAYIGLKLILLMTFAGTDVISGSKMEIMNTEIVSTEILRLLAGSIGLVLTIPITAFVAASWDRVTGFLKMGGRSS